MGSLLKTLKAFFALRGTESRINKIKEIRQQILVLIMVVGLLFSILIPVLILKKAGIIMNDLSPKFDKNIAVIHLDKQITVPYINQFMYRLEEVKKQVKKGSFKHLLIVASSPGGSPQGSDELANYLLEYQKEIPVTFYIQNVCASGCYYIASAIKKNENEPLSGIIANANSVVGSIGVVMPHFVYGPALEKLGMRNEYIVEGDYKVPMDGWSLASEESKIYIKKNLLAPVYKTFQNFVQEHRGLSDEEMKEVNGGRIFISTIVEGILIDRISYYDKIRKEIKAKIEKENPGKSVGFVPVGVEPAQKSLFNIMFNVEELSVDGSGFSVNSKDNEYNMN